jgi:hypothetical protein
MAVRPGRLQTAATNVRSVPADTIAVTSASQSPKGDFVPWLSRFLTAGLPGVVFRSLALAADADGGALLERNGGEYDDLVAGMDA